MARLRSLLARIVALGALLVGTIALRFIQAAPATAEVAPGGLPTVTLTTNNHGELKTDDTFDFRPGLIQFSISGPSNCPVWFIRLHDGYSYSDFRSDQYAVFQGDAAAGARLWANSDYLGGAPGRTGRTVTGTVTLPSAGDYVVTSFGRRLNRPVRFTLSGGPENRAQPATDATIVATATGQWTGDTTLPTTGTLRFTNDDSVPHQLYLQPVADGTTTESALAWFQSNQPGPEPPAWILPGPRLGLEPIDGGATETRSYTDYAPGTYMAWQQGWGEQYPPTMIEMVHIGG